MPVHRTRQNQGAGNSLPCWGENQRREVGGLDAGQSGQGLPPCQGPWMSSPGSGLEVKERVSLLFLGIHSTGLGAR